MPFEKVIGADISPAMLTVARQRSASARVTFLECDATRLSLPDASVDLTISVRFAGHLPDDALELALAEMRRASRGRLIVEIPLARAIGGMLKRTVLKRLAVTERLPKKFDWHARSRERFIELAERSGWQYVRDVPKLPILSDSYFFVFHIDGSGHSAA
jgi:ubiquinone/menaquinone biosynthesis C-methylase UbiE